MGQANVLPVKKKIHLSCTLKVRESWFCSRDDDFFPALLLLAVGRRAKASKMRNRFPLYFLLFNYSSSDLVIAFCAKQKAGICIKTHTQKQVRNERKLKEELKEAFRPLATQQLSILQIPQLQTLHIVFTPTLVFEGFFFWEGNPNVFLSQLVIITVSALTRSRIAKAAVGVRGGGCSIMSTASLTT